MKNFGLLFLISISLVVASCKNKSNEKEPYLRPISIEVTKQDTMKIMDFANIYLENFKSHNYKACADMLYEVRNDSLFPISEEKKEKYVKAMNFLPIKDAKITGLTIRDKKNNSVCMTVLLKEGGDIDKEDGVTHFYLNPVLKDGNWYMTLLDEKAEGVENIYERK